TRRLAAHRLAPRHPPDLLSRGHSRSPCLFDGSSCRGTTSRGDGEIKYRYQPVAISEGLLEISAGDGAVRNRQLQQRLSDPTDQGYRRLVDGDDLDLCRLQPCGSPDFLPGGISVGQTGQEERPG